jgi:hypothetical protein
MQSRSSPSSPCISLLCSFGPVGVRFRSGVLVMEFALTRQNSRNARETPDQSGCTQIVNPPESTLRRCARSGRPASGPAGPTEIFVPWLVSQRRCPPRLQCLLASGCASLRVSELPLPYLIRFSAHQEFVMTGRPCGERRAEAPGRELRAERERARDRAPSGPPAGRTTVQQ